MTVQSENYKTFMELDEKQYENKYVVIIKGKVVSSGDDAEKLFLGARKKFPEEIPLIAKIPSEEVLVL